MNVFGAPNQRHPWRLDNKYFVVLFVLRDDGGKRNTFCFCDLPCEIGDRDVFTRTNIEMRFRRVSFADENAGLGQIIRKDEFEPRGGNNLGSPTVNVWGTGFVATSLAMDFAISLPWPWSYIDVLTTL